MNTLRAEQPEIIRKAFPSTWYYPKWRLVVWYPRGVLNDAFADQIVKFVEMEERLQDEPFEFFADEPISFGIAQIYEILMDKAMIEVRAFRDRKTAAEWLEVPVRILHPPK